MARPLLREQEMAENSFCQSRGLLNRFVGSEEPEGEDGNYWG